ncbi:hypothetical protein [Streptomyces tirandamycinicus]|uniref:Uncharacterized protein n=1 Tax=Streptomyces tirandamycinicus TaxID=2174846 RepID=A0A2S1ST77_9ACTN|nr:hypothetical protein [Streptomyces tirandamycinicus]AWI29594.1 hypothetical protein DDW44_12965 [Streptomyces tirandamycinicus]
MTECAPQDAGLRQLRASLERLSWPAERQLSHLQSLQVDVDELALEFDDAFRLVCGKVTKGRLPRLAVEATQPIDDILDRMANAGAEIWRSDALEDSPEWAELRAQSSQALEALEPLVG